MKLFVEPLLSVIDKYKITKTLKNNYDKNHKKWTQWLYLSLRRLLFYKFIIII